MTDTIVRLAPGRAGWYDEASRLHLTIAKPEASIQDGTNVTNIKKAINLKTLLLVQGDLDSDNFISHEIDYTKLKGKYVANIDYSLAVAEARKKANNSNKPTTPEEPKDPVVPENPEETPEEPEEIPEKPEEAPKEPEEVPEEPEDTEENPDINDIMNQYLPKDKDGEDDGKLPKDDETSISKDSEESKTKKESEKNKENDDTVLHEEAIKISKEIEKKIENSRAISGVNGAIEMIEENQDKLSIIPEQKEKLLVKANDKKISVIKSDIEKAEDEKEFEKIKKAISELDKKDQKGLLDELDKKQK